MKRLKKATIMFATAGLLTFWIAAPAQAATESIWGNQCETGWKNYTVNRETTPEGVKFTPTDMFRWQTSPILERLTLRLNHPNNTPLSAAKAWETGDAGQKSIVTGLVTGTKFRMASTGYSPSVGDCDWAGSLVY